MSDPGPPPPEQIPVPASVPPPAAPPHPVVQKPFFVRTFSLSIGQALRLLGISTLVGFFVLAFDYTPAGTSFDIGGAFTAIIHRTFTAIGWALESFWKPALAGLVVVLPIWAIWRLARAPFRK